MTILHPIQTFENGDDWSIAGTLVDEYDLPFDPTGATAATWKLDDETGTITYATKTLGSGITIATIPIWPVPAVIITVPLATTSGLTPGTYRDQLRLTVGGITSTFWYGPIQVLQSI